jgi:hypothetical protein
MKFKAQVGGLIEGLKPMFVVASKGVQKNYEMENVITLNAVKDYLQVMADGGRVSGKTNIGNSNYNFDYECIEDGTVTVNASSLQKSLESFNGSDSIIFEIVAGKNGNNVRITSTTEKDECQVIPVLPVTCSFQEIDAKGKKVISLSVKRELFMNYANKIMFAHGDSEQFKEFTYWVLRTEKDGYLRFVSGTGNIFAIIELVGKNLSDAKGKEAILFPNDQTATLVGILGSLKCDMIKIESGEKFVCISCGETVINIYNCDPQVKWPDENVFLNRDSKFKFTTKAGSWKNAMKGILATNSDDLKQQNKIHVCSLGFDLSGKVIQTKTDNSLKSFRKVPIEDIGTNEDTKELKILCVSKFMNDIISRAGDEEFLQFEIENPDKPVVVRHYASSGVGDYQGFIKPSDDGFSERYSVFFATTRE